MDSTPTADGKGHDGHHTHADHNGHDGHHTHADGNEQQSSPYHDSIMPG